MSDDEPGYWLDGEWQPRQILTAVASDPYTGKDALPKVKEPSALYMHAPPDRVNRPSHYVRGGMEVIDIVEAWDLEHRRASALQYLLRAGHKDAATEVEDLEKARWFLDREIRRLKARGK